MMPTRSCSTVLAASLAFWAMAGGTFAVAGEIAKPADEVVLTVSGKIKNTNVGDHADFDMKMLQALPSTSFQTSTPWTTGKLTFSGVSLKDFIGAVGGNGSTLHTVSLNDYAIDIPASDAVEGGPIIAYAIEGKPMSIREKGPLWIVYPYDSNAEYRTETVYARSIWQLRQLELQD